MIIARKGMQRMSGKFFKSTGTIRVQLTQGSSWAMTIFFTPNTNSTMCCDGKQYALFIPIEEGEDCLKRKSLDESDEGVEIKVEADLPCLFAAAAQQTLVEVKVKVPKKSDKKQDWILHAITIPAPGKQK